MARIYGTIDGKNFYSFYNDQNKQKDTLKHTFPLYGIPVGYPSLIHIKVIKSILFYVRFKEK